MTQKKSTTTYTVTANSLSGCTNTGTTSVNVYANPVINTQPASTQKCAGLTATFTVVASGASLTYQWYKGGVIIPAAGNPSAVTATLTLTNIGAGDADDYTVVVSSCGIPVTSSIAHLTVGPPDPPSGVTATSPICLGLSTNLNGTSAGNNIFWYDSPSGGTLLGTSASGVNFPYTPAAAGNFTYYAETNSGTSGSQTFTYTGSAQTFTIPASVTSVTVKLWGAGGGTTTPYTPGSGGSGGYTTGTLSGLTPGNTLSVIVGQGGLGNATASYGGGGAGGGSGSTGGGGGRSAILNGAVEVATAGGGGGTGQYFYAANGGAGGGLTGESGGTGSGMTAATGGTQVGGGIGGCYSGSYCGSNGAAGTGGAGSGATIWYGGGGGGGYFGGGGGGSDEGGGGAGGSSYYGGLTGGSTIAGNSNSTNGAPTPAPNNTDPNYIAGVGIGGGNANAVPAGNGLVVISWSAISICPSATRTAVPVTVISYPVITAQPVSPGMICGASPTTVSVTATNATSYQWYKGGVLLTGAAPYSGVTTNTLTITNPTTAENGASLTCVVTNGGLCSVTTNPVSLVVPGPSASPTPVTATPSSICAGSSTNLNATSAGNNIEWYTTPTGGSVSGTSASH